MDSLEEISGTDIYLIDQFLKNRIPRNGRVLDVGCGSGRNIKYLLERDYDVTAFDINSMAIEELKSRFPNQAEQFLVSSIENFPLEQKFDFIICNAVLHFANSHAHFELMFEKLLRLLSEKGVLFIRMTSAIGLPNQTREIGNGVYLLEDGSERYLVSRKQISALVKTYNLKYLEPVKSVLVEGLRSMCTLVLCK